MIEPLIGFGVLLSSANDVVHFSMPPQVQIETDPPTIEYACMTFSNNTTCNCTEFDFIGHENDCYDGQPESALCGIIKQNVMSRPALKYEYRFKTAVPDAGLQKAISDAINTTYGVTYGAFGWPCKAEGIQELDAKNLEIADLTGIENLIGLQRLWLDGNTLIQDIRPLSSLTTLTELHLAGCTGISPYFIWPVRRLHNLEILDLSGCTQLDSLNRVLIDPCPPDGEGESYSYLTNLRELNLTGCSSLTRCGTSILGHMDLSHLEKLYISGCSGIQSLDCLVLNTTLGAGATIYANDLNWAAYPDLKQDIVCLRSERLVTVETNCPDLPASCVNHNPVCRADCASLHDQYWRCPNAVCENDPDCP